MLVGNYYFPLSGWRANSDDFPQLTSAGWLQARPAKGLDLIASGALPRLPGFSVNASYQQFFGNDIEVSNGDTPVRNLYQSAVSLNYQPFPLLTLSIGYVHEKGGEHGLRGGINLAYYFATPLSEQITRPQCDGFSFFPAVQLHRLVMRDNNIRLEYRKQQIATQTIAFVTDVELLPVTGGMTAQTGETNGYAVSAVIRDQLDQTLSYQDVVFATSATGAQFQDIELVSDQNGFVRTQLTSTEAGQIPFTIATAQNTYQGVADFMAADETAGLENLASEIDVVADGAYANGTYSNTVRVTLTDSDNNSLSGKTIQFSTAMEELTISPQNGGITDVQGQALADLTTTRAGIYPVSASFQSHTLSEQVVFVADSTTADLANTFSSITQTGSPALADGTATIVVTASLRDAYDNPVSGEYVTFQDTYNLNITPASTLTDDNGQVIAEVTTSYADIYNVVASYNGRERGIDIQFLANTATAVLTLTETGSPAEAGDNSGVIVTAQLLDDNDNPVRHQLVTFPAVPDLEITPLNDLTDKYGQMLAAVKSSTAGTYTVSGAYNDNTASVAVTFIASAAETISLAATANNVMADNATITDVIATVLDRSGNPVSNVPVSFTVPADAGATLGTTGPVMSNDKGLASTTVRSLQSGILVVTGTIIPQAVEVQATTEITFVADESTADLNNLYSSIVASGSPAPADGSTKIVIMATLKDGNNNPVSGAEIAFSSVSGLNLVPLNTSTNDNGQIFANASAVKADIYPVTAVYKGVQRSIDVVFEAVAGTAGLDRPGAGLTVIANDALADGIAINAVTATLTDANGNPVPDQQITFSSVEGVTITPDNDGITNAYGQVMAAITSVHAGEYPITASYNDQLQMVSVDFLPGAATLITLTGVTGSLLANDIATANVVASVTDANGNSVSGETVIFAVPADAGATLGTNTPIITNSNGLATTTIRGKKSGTVIVTANTPAVGVPASTAVQFVSDPGTADITNPFSSVTEVGSPAMANGAEQIVVTATLKDANGNPVAGEAVTFPDVAGLTIVARNTETNVDGQVIADITSIMANTYAVSASYKNQQRFIDIIFEAPIGTPDITHPGSTLTQTGSPALANGVAQVVVTATLSDEYGNPMSGHTITFPPVSGLSITPRNSETNEHGQVIADVTSLRATTYAVTAQFSDKSRSVDITFTGDGSTAEFGNPEAGLSVTLDNAPANGRDANVVTATITDVNGNPVANELVTFSVPDDSVILAVDNGGQTNSAGQITASLRSNQVGTYAVYATHKEKKLGVNVAFIADAGNASLDNVHSKLIVTVNNATVSSDNCARISITGVSLDNCDYNQIQVTLADQIGNPVPNQYIAFSSPTGLLKIRPQHQGVTDENGILMVQITSEKAGSHELIASYKGHDGTSTRTATVNFTSGPAYKVALPRTIARLPANNTDTINVVATVTDQFGNAVAGVPVSFCISDLKSAGIGVTLGYIGPINSNAAGEASVSVRGSETGNASIAAQIAEGEERVTKGSVIFTSP